MSSSPPSVLFACGLAAASATGPPAPPPLEIFPRDIVSTRTAHDGKRNVTFLNLDPATMEDRRLALPPLPPPAAPITEELQNEPVDTRPVQTLAFGAGVHIPDQEHPEQAVTRLDLWNSGQRGVSFWVPANFLWLSGHGDFGTETVRYRVMMAVSEGGGEVSIPEFSSLPAKGFIVTEGQPTAEETAAVQAMLDFYHQDTEALRVQYEARRVQAAAAAAERAANPPERKNMILRYWRVDDAGIRAAREGGAK